MLTLQKNQLFTESNLFSRQHNQSDRREAQALPLNLLNGLSDLIEILWKQTKGTPFLEF